MKVFDSKIDMAVELHIGMRVKFKATAATDPLVIRQEQTCFTVIKMNSYIHFDDGTHTNKPEALELWHDDLHDLGNLGLMERSMKT